MATVPILGLFISAVALTISTLIATVRTTVEAVITEVSIQSMLVEYIEYADFFLLSIVLYIIAIGLYSLFIDEKIALPKWLEFHSLDDLKEKLVSVVVAVIGVSFLGQIINTSDAKSVMFVGIGIAAVIFSLAYFVKHVMGSHAQPEDDKDK